MSDDKPVAHDPHDTSRARRLHGDRYVTGTVRYLDDGPKNHLHLVFLRSPHAHARLRSIDTGAASALPGVRAVRTGRDTEGAIADLVCLTPPVLTGTADWPKLPCLPVDRIRYAGEAVALVVADSEALARRALERIVVDYEVLPPLLEIEAAMAEGAPVLQPQFSSNVVMAGGHSSGQAEAEIRGARHVAEGKVHIGRSSAIPLEPRGCIASWDADESRLLVRAAVQQPHAFRSDLARQLSLPESDVHVVTPPLGGAFGFKFVGQVEEPLVCLLALQLRKSVRWVETREEALLVGAREYDLDYRVGFGDDGKVAGLVVKLDANVGALVASPGPLMPIVGANTVPGPYDIPHLDVTWRAVMTNKGPWNGARGYGKEAACLVLETAMDHMARVLGCDPVDVRRANLLQPDQFPHRTATMTVDSGSYQRALDDVLELSGYHAKRAAHRAQPPAQRAGLRSRRGLGLGFELTPEGYDGGGSLIRGYEAATVRIHPSGHATVLTGVTSPGTGSETAIAQLVAQQLGIPTEHVRVVQGDTDKTPYGSGSFSSRAVLVGGTAAWLAAGDLREKLVAAAAALLGVTPTEIEVGGGLFRAFGEPAKAMPIGAVVHAFRSLGGAMPGIGEPQLESTRIYNPQNIQAIPDASGRLQLYPTYAYSVHVAEVEVDLETGVPKLLALAAVHDCGTIINVELVNAQMHGAIAMGVGMALTEEEIYDAEGRPRSTSFKRYLLPRVQDLPRIRCGHVVSPSPFTLLGTKGAGESGVGGSAAAIAAAIRDATGDTSGLPVRLPLTAERVLERIDHVRGAS